jgi:HK97 family phage major capsid protein
MNAIREAADAGRTEPGFHAPQVIVRKDPADVDLDAVARGWVPGSEMKSRALTVIENARGVADSAKESATRHVERDETIARHALLVGSEAYRSAFEMLLRHGPDMAFTMMSDEQRHAMRGTALSNTDGNGGYTIPFLLDPSVILTNDGIAGSIRSISRVETGTSDAWNGIASAGVTAEWLGEATEAAEAGPTVTQPSITAIKGAAAITVSYEQMQDGQLVSQLPRLIADAKNRLEEAAFATGAGSTTAPTGVVTATTAVTASRVSPTTGGTFTSASIADVYKVANAVAPRHAANVSWLANKATLNTIRQMDTYGGSAFWANLGMATPAQLLGQPVYENSTMTATVTTGSNILLAGDFSEYLVYDRVGTTLLYDPIVKGVAYRPTGQGQWFAFWRTGAGVLNANAFRVLKL